MNTLKEKIKTLAALQIELKNQRRTVRLSGLRTMSPGEASWKHMTNRDTLRHMYIAYGFMRGKTLLEIEGKSKEAPNLNYVDKFVKEFTEILQIA